MKMDLTPTMHAVKRYAERVMRIRRPNSEQINTAHRRLVSEFHDADVVKLHESDRRRGHLRMAISPKGTHALIGHDARIITIYEPGTPVRGCWCTSCLCARAPKLAQTKPPRIKRRNRREW